MICLEEYSAQPAKLRKSWINAYDSWFKKSPHKLNQYCSAVVWGSCAHQGRNGSIGCQNALGVRSDDADDTYYESHFGRARVWREGFSSVLAFRFGGSFPYGWRPYCHVLNVSDLDSTTSLLFDIGEKLYGRKIVNL
jgi:hypothetical protein